MVEPSLRFQSVKRLIEMGCDVNLKDKDRNTALDHLLKVADIGHNQSEKIIVIEQLLEAGAVVTLENVVHLIQVFDINSPFIQKFLQSCPYVLKNLNDSGESLIRLALKAEFSVGVVQKLLGLGATTNDRAPKSILLEESVMQNPDMLQTLMDAGEKFGNDALEAFCKFPLQNIATLMELEEFKALRWTPENIQRLGVRCPFVRALESRNLALMKFVLERTNGYIMDSDNYDDMGFNAEIGPELKRIDGRYHSVILCPIGYLFSKMRGDAVDQEIVQMVEIILEKQGFYVQEQKIFSPLSALLLKHFLDFPTKDARRNFQNLFNLLVDSERVDILQIHRPPPTGK
jgi:hypothetical protein